MSAQHRGPDLAIHASVWVAPSAQLFGKIAIGEGSSVWHNVVARAECQEIRIGRMTNVQDFVMLHVGYDVPTIIGDFCSTGVSPHPIFPRTKLRCAHAVARRDESRHWQGHDSSVEDAARMRGVI